MVEHTTENRGVAGSIPALATPPDAPAPADGAGAQLGRDVQRQLGWIGILANGVGAVLVALFILVSPDSFDAGQLSHSIHLVTPVFVAYMAITIPLGRITGNRAAQLIWDWLEGEEPATEQVPARVLRAPRAFALNSAAFWALAAVVFGTLIATIQALEGLNAVGTILLGGLTACALQYLLVERAMRPVVGRALAGGAPPPTGAPGVAARLTMAWALGTGVPLFGIAGLVVADVLGADVSHTKLLDTTIFLVVLAIVLGLAFLLLAARSVGEPVAAVQLAMEEVEGGNLGASVAVDDGSEVGRLQAGFNRMASGLAERERLKDLFGRHVGRDVAAAALEQEAQLGGETKEVAALFVDVIGSTTFAVERPPDEVVEMLNRFFAVVVAATDANGGWVNKFEGDGALCVFGAPVAIGNPGGSALAAARQIHAALGDSELGIPAGIGVSAGPAVAGNVGAEERFEYTVIGDPVNEAARLCELAKGRGGLLASDAVLRRANAAEAGHWKLGEEVVLRGREDATRLALPADVSR